MKKMTLLLSFLISTGCTAEVGGDVAAGKGKSQTCLACHGEAGVSINPIWPNLAGQHASYLLKQLHDYKKGTERHSALMAPVVQPLSDEDMGDLAVFYASLPIAIGTVPKKYLERGEQLYRGGDFKAGVAACIACHGPDGKGNAQAKFPVLSGQHAEYTKATLYDFKEGKRKNDYNGIMREIGKRMTNDDIEAVAYYIQGLH